MVFAQQAIMSANSLFFFNNRSHHPNKNSLSALRASSDEEPDCNVEECAPDKEVGKVSMEWLAGEKTKVAGTFPPRNRGWTGYVEKDTAGQTNIYSIEPPVYVAESIISSGTEGSSAEGAENTAAIAAGIALISIAAASSLLLQVGKNSPPKIQTVKYSGPSLTYYINKFKPSETVEAPVSTESEAVVIEETVVPEVTDVQVEIGDATLSAPEIGDVTLSAPEIGDVTLSAPDVSLGN